MLQMMLEMWWRCGGNAMCVRKRCELFVGLGQEMSPKISGICGRCLSQEGYGRDAATQAVRKSMQTTRLRTEIAPLYITCLHALTLPGFSRRWFGSA